MRTFPIGLHCLHSLHLFPFYEEGGDINTAIPFAYTNKRTQPPPKNRQTNLHAHFLIVDRHSWVQVERSQNKTVM